MDGVEPAGAPEPLNGVAIQSRAEELRSPYDAVLTSSNVRGEPIEGVHADDDAAPIGAQPWRDAPSYNPSTNPFRQLGYFSSHCSTRCAWALEAPRIVVMIATPPSPMNSRASHAGIRRGGFAPRALAR